MLTFIEYSIMLYTVLSDLHVLSLKIFDQLLLSLFYRLGNWAMENLINLAKITCLGRSRAGFDFRNHAMNH